MSDLHDIVENIHDVMKMHKDVRDIKFALKTIRSKKRAQTTTVTPTKSRVINATSFTPLKANYSRINVATVEHSELHVHQLVEGGGFFGKWVQRFKNALPNSDSTGRPAFQGENHSLLVLPSGRPGIGNYIGPGTHVVERIRRGDPPRTMTDKVAQAHDIRYTLAVSLDEIRYADEMMVYKLQQMSIAKQDSAFNIQIGMRLIQLKMHLEDKNWLDRNKFASLGGTKLSQEDRQLLQSKLSQLQSEGF